jgi:hypothetical protein
VAGNTIEIPGNNPSRLGEIIVSIPIKFKITRWKYIRQKQEPRTKRLD